MHFEATNENCDGFIPVKRAAQKLSVSPRTVWRMIADGDLKATHIRGCTRLSYSDVVRYSKKKNQLERV
jgi:excisionase family DNA binding protein